MVKVSFIIPAYNAADYIIRCLDSIYNLELPRGEFEVIVVDDCSTDDTVAVVEDLSLNDKYPNLVLLKQTVNQRQGAARNRGLSVARGKYIVYIDSDDEAANGVVQALAFAEKNNLELIAFHSEKVDETGRVTPYEKLLYSEKDVFSGIQLQTEHPFWFTGPVAYVYRKDFLDKVNYPFTEGVLFEDSDYVNNHLYAAKRMGYIAECGYRIFYNSTSTTHTMSYKHVADYFLLGTRMLALYDRIEDKRTKYADSIREGGSFNIWMSFKRLWKLDSIVEVKLFYQRLEEKGANLTDYLQYGEPAYCWTWWTRLGLKHKNIMTIISGIMIVGRKMIRRK